MALPTVPGVTAAFVLVKLINPTLPVTKNLNGPGVSNFGPNNPVNGRTLVVTNCVLTPLLKLEVKLRWKSYFISPSRRTWRLALNAARAPNPTKFVVFDDVGLKRK